MNGKKIWYNNDWGELNGNSKRLYGAYGVIIHDERIALVRKDSGGYKGKLDLPGGGIEHTENLGETLKREILEEIGI